MVHRLGLLTLALLLRAAPSFAAEPPLVLGLHPNISARTVIDLYQPLRQYLEQSLKRPVEIYTAPDFQTYVTRTMHREYDIAVTAPHLVPMAQRTGYIPLFHYATELTAVVIVAKDSAIHRIEDLHGKTIALPDPMTIISIMGIDYLRKHRLIVDRDIKIFSARSHNNAAIAVERAQAAAAIVGSVPFKQLPAELRADLRIVAHTESVPSQFIIVSDRLPLALRERIRDSLQVFAATDAGAKWFKTNGFGGLRAVTPATLKRLAPYSKAAEQMMEHEHESAH